MHGQNHNTYSKYFWFPVLADNGLFLPEYVTKLYVYDKRSSPLSMIITTD